MLYPSMPLTTERLQLRGFVGADLAELAALLADPQVMRYSVRGVMSRSASAEFLEHCRVSLAEEGFAPLAVIEQRSARLVGFCGLCKERFEEAEEVMLGYRLSPAFWNQGMASEAVKVVLAHGFGTLAVSSVVAVVEPQNQASIQVLHKAGFQDYLHARYFGMGVRLYRMTRERWQALLITAC
ncbi:N-acetyltransferase GCN5 [Pseudomonas sp. StFLB209]|nr:N-acetyltransferase GCN5 [Pseudomonas sp. StFLB209]